MDNGALSYQQIVESISLDDMMASVAPSKETLMSVDDQKRELAIVARMLTKAHAGYDSFDEQKRLQFEESIEQFYNDISHDVDVASFYKRLDKSLQILPDEHLKIEGKLFVRDPNIVLAGSNICDDKSKKWEIKSAEDGKTAVIALPRLGLANPDEWLAFSQELDEKLFNKDGSEKYEALVIDIRDNPGGAAVPFEILAKKLYGNDVAPFEKSMRKDTKEADYLRFINGEISRETFEDRLKNHTYSGKMVEICDYSSHAADFPAFAAGGYKKPIVVLTNRGTASAGESLCQFLKHHPGVTYVGENTAGCYAEISGEPYKGKFGIGVKIGTTHAVFENNEVFERKGFPVDIDTSGKDAYAYTMAHLEEIKEKANEKILAHNIPTFKKEFDKLANNDFAFIRGINKGMDKEWVKNLYEKIYPDKKQNFASVVGYAVDGVFSERPNEIQEKLTKLRKILSAKKTPYKPEIVTVNPAELKIYKDARQGR